MRKILFRGKIVDNGEWVEGLLWKKKYDTNKIFISYFPDKDDREEVDVVIPETVGQCTGLKDKNGVKIFEGDIVKVKDILLGDIEKYNNFKGVVEYRDNAFGISDGNLCHLRWFAYEIEVIGNTHDNPELLEVE